MDSCKCDSKIDRLEKELTKLREEFEFSQNYMMELINNLTVCGNEFYGIEDEDYFE